MVRIVTKLFRFRYFLCCANECVRELLVVRIPLVGNWHSSVNLLEEVKTKTKMKMAQQIRNFVLNFIDRIYRKNELHLLNIESGCDAYEGDTFLQDLKSSLSLAFPLLPFFCTAPNVIRLFARSFIRLVDSVDTCDVCLFVMYIWTDGKYFVVKLILTQCRFVFFRICDVVQYSSSAC